MPEQSTRRFPARTRSGERRGFCGPEPWPISMPVRLAPVIFQQFIPAESDLRITAVGGKLFPAAIRSPDGLVDFRLSVGDAALSAEELPVSLSEKLLALLKRLGLAYGAIDMRRTPRRGVLFF